MDGKLIVLNDQGGAVMDISYEKTATLRAQDHGHPPVICLQGGGETSQNSQGCGFSEGGVSYTVNTIDRHAVCYAVYDARGNGEGGWLQRSQETIRTE